MRLGFHFPYDFFISMTLFDYTLNILSFEIKSHLFLNQIVQNCKDLAPFSEVAISKATSVLSACKFFFFNVEIKHVGSNASIQNRIKPSKRSDHVTSINFWRFTIIKVICFEQILEVSDCLPSLTVTYEMNFLSLAPSFGYTIRIGKDFPSSNSSQVARLVKLLSVLLIEVLFSVNTFSESELFRIS